MEKMFYSELIKTYKTKIDEITRLYNDAIYKAINAGHRGDVVNYKKNFIKAEDYKAQMVELNRCLNMTRDAFNAI